MHIQTLAYQYVAIAIMLSAVSDCVNRLGLPEKEPITAADIRFAMATPLGADGWKRPGGRINTLDFGFGFWDGGIRSINLVNDQGGFSFRRYAESLPSWQTSFTTNDAYRVATNWLTIMDVDVARLEKDFPPIVKQQPIDPKAWNRKEHYAPVFWVRWGKSVTAEMGPHGELLYYQERSDACSHQKIFEDEITNLLDLPDEVFNKYTPAERTNLVLRYAGPTFMALTNR